MNQPTSTTGAGTGQQGNPVVQPPLNEARRPQRLFLKTRVAMNLAVKWMFDRRFTELGQFLSGEKLQTFKKEVRENLRKRLDESIDNWPVRTPHDYRPDVRFAIIKAIEENWEFFNCEEESGHLGMNEALGGGDESCPSELLLPAFYEQ